MAAPDARLDLWRQVQLLHLQLTAELHRGLMAEVGLGYQDFVVLSELATEPRRVVELAATIGLEKSRLSHQIDRLQTRDLVARRATPGDARGALVVLTPAGRRLHKRAMPGHLARVARHFGEQVTTAEAAVLERVATKVTATLG